MPDTPDIAAMTAERIRVLDAEIARLTEERERLSHSLNILLGRLTDTNQSDNTNDMRMQPFEKLKRSKGHPTNPRTARLRSACNAKNMSIRDLATLARKKTRYRRISQAHLSMAAAGDRPIDMELAEWIAGQVDYPATAGNWPKLRTERTE